MILSWSEVANVKFLLNFTKISGVRN